GCRISRKIFVSASACCARARDSPRAITEKGPTTAPGEINEVSAGDFTDWQAQAPVFTGVAAYQSWEFHALTGGGDPDEVWASPVTPNLFQVLGVNAFRGR